MRVFLMLGGVLGNIWRIVHASQQIKKREDKNPDKIDKVPEEPGDFDAIGEVLRISLINFFADRQPHVEKNKNAAEHVRTVQSGDGEVAGEIRAVPWTEWIDAFDVVLLTLRDFIG